MTLALGDTILDLILQDILDPENRSILLNPQSRFGSVALCDHIPTKQWLKVANYATSASANDEALAEIKKLLTKPVVAPEVNEAVEKAQEEKERLQNSLI